MYRFVEKFFGSHLPSGHPIDTNHIICCAIDKYGPTKKRTLIIYENKHGNDKYHVETDIQFDKLKKKIADYLNNKYQSQIYDDTWALDPRFGFFLEFRKLKNNRHIEMRLLNLSEDEINFINKMRIDSC